MISFGSVHKQEDFLTGIMDQLDVATHHGEVGQGTTTSLINLVATMSGSENGGGRNQAAPTDVVASALHRHLIGELTSISRLAAHDSQVVLIPRVTTDLS